jgi:hypothetical protein
LRNWVKLLIYHFAHRYPSLFGFKLKEDSFSSKNMLLELNEKKTQPEYSKTYFVN